MSPKIDIIDYVSLSLSQASLVELNYFISGVTNGVRRDRAWCTVCYSRNRVRNFPIPDWNLEDTMDRPLENSIIVEQQHIKGFEIFTDPYGVKHLVLVIKHPRIDELYESYRNRGAVWDFNEYQSHITIQSDTQYTEEYARSLAKPDFPLVFEMITHSRFGETVMD